MLHHQTVKCWGENLMQRILRTFGVGQLRFILDGSKFATLLSDFRVDVQVAVNLFDTLEVCLWILL